MLHTRARFRRNGNRKIRIDWIWAFQRSLEARAGIEPAHKGFADLSLTTWVPRPWVAASTWGQSWGSFQTAFRANSFRGAVWSGRRDLNSRPSPWQGDALPLSYSRFLVVFLSIAAGHKPHRISRKTLQGKIEYTVRPPLGQTPAACPDASFCPLTYNRFMHSASIAAPFARAAAAAAPAA